MYFPSKNNIVQKAPKLDNSTGLRVLVCPLNWGLGHATRCVPLIRQYLNSGNEVVIAADGVSLEFLRTEFPELNTIFLPSYKIRYSKGKTQVWAMLRSLPAILYGIFSEHFWLKKLLKTEYFDLVVSDNRFGLWSKKTDCIYITHQLMVKMPKSLNWFEKPIWRFHRFFINKYNECLIPDFEGIENLSGDLSHKYPLPQNARFIGVLSRFSDIKIEKSNKIFEIVAIISGPEPQRTIFEKQIISKYEKSENKTLVVCGLPQNKISATTKENLTIVPHLPDNELAAYLIAATKIISRSGYSTIMDLHALNCLGKAEFIPTPGQTEQEYLYEYLKK
jgi:uncharacterized protein (TIGR00661 family)